MTKKTPANSVSEANELLDFVQLNYRSEIPSNQEIAKQRKILKCPNCGKCYFKGEKYWRHLRSHLNYHPYGCNVCLQSFNKKEHLKTHKRKHEPLNNDTKTFKCLDCSKHYEFLSALNRHNSYHNESPPYQCPICRAKFNSISTRSMHVKNHVVTCILCKIDFQSNTQLVYHIAEVHRLKDTEGKPVKPNMSTGVKRMDSNNDELEDSELKFICFVCERRFSSEQLMTSHLKAHKLFLCSYCPQFFPTRNDFQNHERQHIANHPFKCQICLSIFESPESLLDHEKRCKMTSSGTDIKNMVCNEIDMSKEVLDSMKNVLGADTTAREPVDNCDRLKKLQRELENVLGLGSSENPTASRNMLNEAALSTQHLDDSPAPSLDFNDHLHFHWLISFKEKVKFESHPLPLNLLEKAYHISKLIGLELTQLADAECNKLNFLYLVTIHNELLTVLKKNTYDLYNKI